MAILELIDVSKSFGEKKVLNHLSLTVKEKTIFGFIGKNGAGKTTTMKLILGLLKKDAGTIKVNDETVHYGQTKIAGSAICQIFRCFMTTLPPKSICNYAGKSPRCLNIKSNKKRKSY